MSSPDINEGSKPKQLTHNTERRADGTMLFTLTGRLTERVAFSVTRRDASKSEVVLPPGTGIRLVATRNAQKTTYSGYIRLPQKRIAIGEQLEMQSFADRAFTVLATESRTTFVDRPAATPTPTSRRRPRPQG